MRIDCKLNIATSSVHAYSSNNFDANIAHTLEFTAQVWEEPKHDWQYGTPVLKAPPMIYEAHVGMSSEECKIASWTEFRKHMLPRIVGVPHALDLLFSARKVGAAEAERMGLVNRAIPHETFMEEVRAYARHLAHGVSPRATAVMKAQVWKALYQGLGEAIQVGDEEMQKSFGTEDFKEGVAAFNEKRKPDFKKFA